MQSHEPVLSTVLNVDDFEPGRYARSRLLSSAGYIVHEAASGEGALTFVRQRRPPLVILDVHLPDMSGLEVCRRIKEDATLSSTLVLQVSATSISATDWVTALDRGADAYLIEPVDPGVLLGTVRALLRLARTDQALKEANAELRRSNEDLARFAHAASHDLQEPLRTIASYSQLLQKRYSGKLDTDADQFIQFVVDAAVHMSTLIRDLLTYAQIGSRRRREIIDLGEVLSAALRNLRVALEESGAEVTAGTLPLVRGDADQLTQVLQNLLSNSIKYRSDMPPRIEICSDRRGDEWVLSVKDNGIGFPPQYAEHIFEPFRRLHVNLGGTGIGLAIVRRTVEAHGGRIWAESEPGKGAMFLLTLPVAEDSAPAVNRATSE